jgi:hypothetical protein
MARLSKYWDFVTFAARRVGALHRFRCALILDLEGE